MVTTKKFAKRFKTTPQYVIARVCNSGSYFSIVPTKRYDGKWDWPDPDEAYPIVIAYREKLVRERRADGRSAPAAAPATKVRRVKREDAAAA